MIDPRTTFINFPTLSLSKLEQCANPSPSLSTQSNDQASKKERKSSFVEQDPSDLYSSPFSKLKALPSLSFPNLPLLDDRSLNELVQIICLIQLQWTS